MRTLWPAVLLVALTTGALQTESSRSQTGSKLEPPRTCDRRVLGPLLVLDTSRLVRAGEFPIPVENTEGAAAELFLQDGVPRYLEASYAGEGGRITERYYFGANGDFVVEAEEVRYAISGDLGSARYSSRMPSVHYFCHGRPLTTGGPDIGSLQAMRLQALRWAKGDAARKPPT